MKICYFFTPCRGNVNQVVEVIGSLVRENNQVLCYTSKEFEQEIRHVGGIFKDYVLNFHNIQ